MIRVNQLQALIDRFSKTRILVVGDVMLDEYIWGKVSRISPEAPVPIVEVVSESLRLGGAANVVNNLWALGGQTSLTGVVGNDANGNRLRQVLQEIGVAAEGIVTDTTRPTTLKTRIIAHHQQVVRLDREQVQPIQAQSVQALMTYITQVFPAIDGVIIEDYNKGTVTHELVQHIVTLATQTGKVVAVDPKPPHYPFYHGVSVATPNHHEAGAAMSTPITDHASLLWTGQHLLELLASELVLITRGEEGMSLFERQARTVTHIPAMAQEVYDVTGAGDTVIAVLTLALASGAMPADAAILANAAAGVVVGKVGTATVTPQELHQAIANMHKRHLAIQKEKLP